MGSDNFFSKLESIDPLARAVHAPGADKYAQAVAQRNAGATDVNGGPFTGVTPTLAAANAGYTANAPGAPAGWQQINLGNNPSWLGVGSNAMRGLFGTAQTPNTNQVTNAPPAALPPASAYVGAAQNAARTAQQPQNPWGQ